PGGITGAVVDEESLIVGGAIAMMEEVFEKRESQFLETHLERDLGESLERMSSSMSPGRSCHGKAIVVCSFAPPVVVDGNDKKNKKMKGASGFQVGKRKLKTKLTALAKAKAAQAMEVDK
ncbi:hypothetical protein C3L33_07984, partial [Rhododendron williamsianum]